MKITKLHSYFFFKSFILGIYMLAIRVFELDVTFFVTRTDYHGLQIV